MAGRGYRAFAGQPVNKIQMKVFVTMKFYFAAAAAMLALPTVAHAQAYVQVQTGIDSISVQGSSDEGVAYGVAAGYSVPLGSAFFGGVEVSLDESNTKYCERGIVVAGDRACVRTGRDIAAVARLGTQVGEKTQLYVLGGYTNARIRASYDDGATRTSFGSNGDGFRLGAGFQQDFSDNLFGKVEYRYSNYESDFSRHNGVVAIGLKF